MKILSISSTFPYPPSRGGTQVRTFNLIRYLSKNHKLTLIAQLNPDVTEAEVLSLRRYVDKLLVFPPPTPSQGGKLAKIKRFWQFLRQGTPPNVLYLYSREIQLWVDQAIANHQFDLITCEHSVNEIYIRPEWKEKIPTFLNIHSSVYLTCKNQLFNKNSVNSLRDFLYLPLLRYYEKKTISKFSQIVVTTDEDKKQIEKFSKCSSITVVSNGVNLDIFPYRPSDPGGYKLIFFGGLDYLANIDAAKFLSLEILPKLRQKYPQTTLTLVGSKPSPEILQLDKISGITVTGRVPTIATYLHQATVCVIPMRIGFGIKNKTLEALAAGVPVVASDCGLEGLDFDSNPSSLWALRANNLEEYVRAISRLFTNPTLREKLSRNGRNLVETKHTWEIVGKSYEEILTKKLTGF